MKKKTKWNLKRQSKGNNQQQQRGEIEREGSQERKEEELGTQRESRETWIVARQNKLQFYIFHSTTIDSKQQQQQLKVSRGDAAYLANITITNGMDGVRYCA